MVPPATKPQYPSSPQDWVKHKSEIVELYDRNELKDVMLHMEQHHNFRATIKQWKTQLKKWGIKKRIEGNEYKSILKIKRKREHEQPGKASEFSIRGTVIPPAKIARYEAEALQKGLITDDDTFSQVATPPSLSCCTPPNTEEGFSASNNPMEPAGPSMSNTMSLQHNDRGFGSDASTPLSPGPANMPSVELGSQEDVQTTLQLPLQFLPHPLHSFHWGCSFLFDILEPLAMPSTFLLDYWHLPFSPFDLNLISYEYECMSIDIVAESRLKDHGRDCMVCEVIGSPRAYPVTHQDWRRFEEYVRAQVRSIQDLAEWGYEYEMEEPMDWLYN